MEQYASLISLQVIVYAISFGFIYVLAAIGFNLISGVLKIVNLTYGHLLLLSSYFFYSMGILLAFNSSVALLIAVAISFVVGMGFSIFVKPVRRKPDSVLILTMAAAVFTEHAIRVSWGPYYYSTPRLSDVVLEYGGVVIESQRLWCILLSAVSLIMLWFFLKKTKYGKAIRMISDSESLALLTGINVEKFNLIVFGLGIGFAALAGSLISPFFGINPNMGWGYMMKVFAITIVGGLGSLSGAVVSGLALATVEGLFGFYVSTTYKDLVYILVIYIALLFRSRVFAEVSERV